MKIDFFDMILKGSKRSTKWLRFYVKVRFPLGIVISSLFFVSSLIKTNFHIENASLLMFVIFLFLLDFANILLQVFTYLEMKKMTPRGYILNVIYLYFFELYYAIVFALSDFYLFWVRFIAGIIVGLAFMIPNLIYFRKRKDLFYRNTVVNADKQPDISENKDKLQDEISIEDEMASKKSYVSASDEIIDTIKKLNALKERGVLTEQEFQEKKNQLLKRI